MSTSEIRDARVSVPPRKAAIRNNRQRKLLIDWSESDKVSSVAMNIPILVKTDSRLEDLLPQGEVATTPVGWLLSDLRGRSAEDRLAHNQEAAGSNPAPVTTHRPEPDYLPGTDFDAATMNGGDNFPGGRYRTSESGVSPAGANPGFSDSPDVGAVADDHAPAGFILNPAWARAPLGIRWAWEGRL